MARNREVPWNFTTEEETGWLEPTLPPHSPIACGEWRPETAMEALMQAVPFVEPALSRAELRELRDTIVDAVDALSPEDRFIFDSYFTRRASLREIGQELGYPPPQYHKTSIARARDRIVQELQMALEDAEIVQDYLKGGRR